jgi:hypothetical protein
MKKGYAYIIRCDQRDCIPELKGCGTLHIAASKEDAKNHSEYNVAETTLPYESGLLVLEERDNNPQTVEGNTVYIRVDEYIASGNLDIKAYARGQNYGGNTVDVPDAVYELVEDILADVS